jgi:hypothetical protein
MSLFFISFLVIALAVGGMAIGIIGGRRPIQGSCGGLNAAGGHCQSCGRDVRRCAVRRPTK